ncbi:MAG: glycosyltransferase 87 family protein [Gaiellaceae bacterium]
MPRPRAALAAGAVCFALVAACAALAWPAGSPLVPRNGGHPVGDRAWAWAFLGCAAAALVAYAVGARLLWRGGALVPVAVLAAAIHRAPLAAPLLLSTDAWTYWDQGRIAAVHGGNPYRDPPNAFPRDPAFRWVGGAWRDSGAVYGPAFTLASEPAALAAGRSHDAAAWIYKALAALAVLAAAALAARLSRRPAHALAFVGWNPLLAVHFAGGGHNDAWVAALVLAALVLGLRGRPQWAGAAWAAAVLVKWVPLLFLPLRALEARATGRRIGHLGFGVTAAAILGVASWRYGTGWLEAFGPLARNANHETKFALPHRLAQLGLPHGLAVGLCVAAFALAYLWLLREAARGRARLGLAAGLLLLALPYLAAWYVVWAVPLAAAEDDEPAQWLSLALCAYLLRQTVPL